MLKIVNGRIYDPANGCIGQERTLYVRDGRICGPSPDEPAEVFDAAGCVVMPGGVEIHSHVAGTKVNSARSMCPEDHYDHFKTHSPVCRAGTGYTVPTSFYTGYEYARLGYTTLFEAAVPPLEARHAHEELKDVPMVDNGIYTLMGNNHMIMEAIHNKDAAGRRECLWELVSWLLWASRGYAVKVVNPGGVESWKWAQGLAGLDSEVAPFGVTSRQIMLELAQTVDELKLPHGMHLHCNHLGEAGNYATTLETMKTLDGLPVHYTHLQFHAYDADKKGRFASAAQKLADYLNDHPGITFDVGQIVFGRATTMTADSPMQYHLHQLSGHKWINCDVEMETGSGVVPMLYKPDTLVNAVQWCIGLELLLLVKNPWQIVLTTDHPNAGPFTAYPHIIRLLMDREYRRAQLATLHPKVGQYTCLAELEREYTLAEIAVITRAAAGRILGLKDKGQLAPGARADIAVYREDEDREKMFSCPAFVFKDGQCVVRDGQPVKTVFGRRLLVEPDNSRVIPADFRSEFEQFYSVALSNFAVQDEYLVRPEVIPCK